ncbi:hypothetical protein ALI144C_37735 [Actinosynnema sp. ALI-1.44]|uniref:AfsR/SARP family transcriptional regulator n=1 Tax=Actinosynnema sp. ALI-1.44 TaxID=1933779 RepID=UPI00097BBCD4|nr:BTAD domain-containing putative transcriptional regulator [Actinosynnema sp. ALI-1.44]ONI76386.1 hypothetical protein ALI144C_37735 [Actinosynnema sp. ALI-1.44]
MEFRVLGPLEVLADNKILPLRAAKQRILLSLLLLRANRTVSADRLIHYLWEEEHAPGDGRASLQVHVTRLRRFLDSCVQDGRSLLRTTTDGYLIEVPCEQLDLSRFEAASARAAADREAGDHAAELAAIVDALSQWRGEALAQVPSDTLRRDEVPALEEKRLQLTERRFDIELQNGNHDGIVGELRACAADNPMRERLSSQLILALYRSGRQAEALAHYREIATRLREELGVDPGVELTALHQAILTAAPELTAPSRTARAGREDTRQLWKVQCQLPADTGDFVGRIDVQEQALAMLQPDEPNSAVPIVTLTGSPGVGKTALAIHLAHHLRSRYPDGQWYVHMGGASGTPRKTVDVLPELLRASGLDRSTLPEDLDACAAIFRSWLADRRVLLVFDDVYNTDQIRHLLPGTPGCAVIVTRRANLSDLVAFHGARPFALDVLSVDESRTLLTSMLGERRAASESVAITELIRLCAHLPLALRIAGASLAARPHHSVADYVTELRTGNRLSALAVGSESRAAIRVAFELSYRELPAAARRLFRWLGSIPGSDFTVPLAAELANVGNDEAAMLLNTLADAHLVETHAVGRYHFHDLLRLYAVERSRNEDEATERDEATHRLCKWYLYTADAAVEAYHSGIVRMRLPEAPLQERVQQFAGSREALTWLDRERPNLVAVVETAANHRLFKISCLLTDTLRVYLHRERRYADWVRAAEVGLRAALRLGDNRVIGAMRLGLGLAYQGFNRLKDASEQIDEALERFREVGAEDFEATTLNAATMVRLQQPTLRIDDALPMLERALELTQQLGLRLTEAQTRRNLGIVHHASGQLTEAIQDFSQANRIYSDLHVRPPLAEILARLGMVTLDLGEPATALGYLQEALALSEYLDSRYDTAVCYQGMAAAYCAEHQYVQAEKYIHQALGLAREHGFRAVEINSANILGTVQLRTNRRALAEETFQLTIDLARQVEHPQGEATALVGLALTHLEQSSYHASIGYAQHAVRTTTHPGFRLVEGKAFIVLARAWYQLEEHHRATRFANQAHEIFVAGGYVPGQEEAQQLIDRIALRVNG